MAVGGLNNSLLLSRALSKLPGYVVNGVVVGVVSVEEKVILRRVY